MQSHLYFLLNECNQTAKVKLNRENVKQKLMIQIPGITNTRRMCENQFVQSKCATDLTTECSIIKQQLKIVTNVLSNSRHTKQQHLDKRFKRNTPLFYNTENACLLVRETYFSVLRLRCSDSCPPWTVMAIVLSRSIYVSRAISCRKANK